MRNMTVSVFVEYMKGALDAYHTKELALKPGDEEYVHEANELEWLEWFNFFLESYEG